MSYFEPNGISVKLHQTRMLCFCMFRGSKSLWPCSLPVVITSSFLSTPEVARGVRVSCRILRQQLLLTHIWSTQPTEARPLQAEPNGPNLTEILKSFLLSPISFFLSSTFFVCVSPPPQHSLPILFAPLHTEITSAWPRGDTVSILFLINLAHWQSLLNNKACPLFFSLSKEATFSYLLDAVTWGSPRTWTSAFASAVKFWGRCRGLVGVGWGVTLCAGQLSGWVFLFFLKTLQKTWKDEKLRRKTSVRKSAHFFNFFISLVLIMGKKS